MTLADRFTRVATSASSHKLMTEAPAAADRAAQLVFPGPAGPLRVGGDDLAALKSELGRLLPGWAHADDLAAIAADITVVRAATGYDVRARIKGCESLSAENLWEAGYQTTSALFHLAAAAGPDQWVAHAGAVERDGRLILFFGDTMAGKSSLALHLAAAGRRIFGDDRMIVAAPQSGPPTGSALGLARKLRLPLPEDFDPAAVAYARARQMAQTAEDVVYLRADGADVAPFGARLPIAAVVMLDRRPEAAPAISAIGAAEAVRRLIALSMAPHLSAGEQLALLARLVGAVPVLRLSAPGSAAAAAALLAHRFD
jgi:hypothetical protein